MRLRSKLSQSTSPTFSVYGGNDFGEGGEGEQFSCDVMSVAAGATHTLVLCRDGRVLSRGSNSNGQLGRRGDENASFESVEVESEIRAVASGNRFSLFLSADGRVFGCGNNVSAQLGFFFGDECYCAAPQAPKFLPHFRRPVRSIVCGADFSVFVMDDGQLYACGANAYGQLGRGVREPAQFVPRPVELDIPANDAVTQLACGHRHVLARTAKGALYTWGYERAVSAVVGAIHRPDGDLPRPKRIDHDGGVGRLPHPISCVAAGGYVSLAVCGDDRLVYSWGQGDHHVGGRSDKRPVCVPLLRDIVCVDAGDAFAVALDAHSRLFVWGRNCARLLTDVSPSKRLYEPVQCAVDGPVTRVYCGAWHCVIQHSTTVGCALFAVKKQPQSMKMITPSPRSVGEANEQPEKVMDQPRSDCGAVVARPVSTTGARTRLLTKRSSVDEDGTESVVTGSRVRRRRSESVTSGGSSGDMESAPAEPVLVRAKRLCAPQSPSPAEKRLKNISRILKEIDAELE